MRFIHLGLTLWLAFPALARAEESEALVVASEPNEPARVEVSLGCGRAGARCPKDEKVDSDVAAVFGIRGSETLVEEESPKAGVSLSIQNLTYVHDRKVHTTGRVVHFAFIGGGRGGIEGGIGIDFGFGLLAPLGERHGPFSRLGFRGELLGNSAFYSSMIELPELQLGYMTLEKNLHFELAARGGPVLAGRYNPDDERRKIGGTFEYGGLLVLGVSAINLDVGWTHILGGDDEPKTDLDILTGLLCGGSGYFGVCMDARVTFGDVQTKLGREAKRSVFLGLTLGAFQGRMLD